MADTIPRTIPAAVTRRFHLLAELRCAYFVELQDSGRWQRYYSHDELVEQMQEAARLAQVWQALANNAQEVDTPAESLC